MADLMVEGFAARTSQWYDIGPGVQELLEPGCFRRSIMDPQCDVALTLEHGGGGSHLPLARTKAGTLVLTEVMNGPQTGLHMRAHLDEADPDVRLLAAKLATGSMDGSASFAFRVTSKSGQRWSDDFSQRWISELNMNGGDVSVVVYPANAAAHVDIAQPERSRRAALAKPRPNYTTDARRWFTAELRRVK
jgi:HK97 family phage prohead protease